MRRTADLRGQVFEKWGDFLQSSTIGNKGHKMRFGFTAKFGAGPIVFPLFRFFNHLFHYFPQYLPLSTRIDIYEYFDALFDS